MRVGLITQFKVPKERHSKSSQRISGNTKHHALPGKPRQLLTNDAKCDQPPKAHFCKNAKPLLVRWRIADGICGYQMIPVEEDGFIFYLAFSEDRLLPLGPVFEHEQHRSFGHLPE